MSCLQTPIDIFNDNSEIGLIKQDFLLLYTSTEKVRRGCFAKNDSTKKELMKLMDVISLRLERIETHLNLKSIDHEKISNLDDLPLLQFAISKTG